MQCAGSRDENYLKHCSGVCCLGSLKQARYVREQYPDAQIYIFYIDIRAPGRLEDFYAAMQKDEKLQLIKGKVAKITEDAASGDLVVEAEDTLSGERVSQKVDLVVLATGIVPADAAVPHRARRRSAERRARVPDRAISPWPACWGPDAPSGRWTWRPACGTPRALP